MKRYIWGFNDNDNPYQKSMGVETNNIVSQFITELGPEGIKIFNSYAPKGYEIKSVDDLQHYPTDAKGGYPQATMFNPDKLTSRSGRVAENSKKIKK
jgi:hypothetical protein